MSQAAPARTTEERRAERGQKILDAAMRVLVSQGFEALTIERVARELDCTVGALYRYFPAKDAILASLQRRVTLAFALYFGRAWERLEALGPEVPRDVASFTPLWATAIIYERLPVECPERFALIARSLADPRKLIRDEYEVRVVDALGPLIGALGAKIDAAVEAGALAPGPAGERAMIVWAGIHGAVQLQKVDRLDPSLFDPKLVVRRTLRNAMLGLGARVEPLDAAMPIADRVLAELGPMSDRDDHPDPDVL